MTAGHVAEALPCSAQKGRCHRLWTPRCRQSPLGHSCGTMNAPWLVLVLALLGGPHALHTGPRDPNIDENMVAATGVGAGEGGGWGQRVGDRPGAHQPQLLPPHRHAHLCSAGQRRLVLNSPGF